MISVDGLFVSDLFTSPKCMVVNAVTPLRQGVWKRNLAQTSVCDIGNMVGKAKMNVGGICSGFSLTILPLFPIIIDLCDKCQLYVS